MGCMTSNKWLALVATLSKGSSYRWVLFSFFDFCFLITALLASIALVLAFFFFFKGVEDGLLCIVGAMILSMISLVMFVMLIVKKCRNRPGNEYSAGWFYSQPHSMGPIPQLYATKLPPPVDYWESLANSDSSDESFYHTVAPTPTAPPYS